MSGVPVYHGHDDCGEQGYKSPPLLSTTLKSNTPSIKSYTCTLNQGFLYTIKPYIPTFLAITDLSNSQRSEVAHPCLSKSTCFIYLRRIIPNEKWIQLNQHAPKLPPQTNALLIKKQSRPKAQKKKKVNLLPFFSHPNHRCCPLQSRKTEDENGPPLTINQSIKPTSQPLPSLIASKTGGGREYTAPQPLIASLKNVWLHPLTAGSAFDYEVNVLDKVIAAPALEDIYRWFRTVKYTTILKKKRLFFWEHSTEFRWFSISRGTSWDCPVDGDGMDGIDRILDVMERAGCGCSMVLYIHTKTPFWVQRRSVNYTCFN